MSPELPELPQDRRERGIFLQALREYSENCEPPELTPDCPFAIKVKPGEWGCGEECMDLLARHGAPGPSEEIEIGEDFVARRMRRPRARRVRNPVAKAYDAREIYLIDKGIGPPSAWRLASVLTGLIELIQKPPPAEAFQATQRLVDIDELIRCAESKGLDLDRHLLFHLRFCTASAVFHQLVAQRDNESGPFTDSARQGWLALADEHLKSDRSGEAVKPLSSAYNGLFAAVTSWARTAPKDDLFEWVAPSALATDRSAPPPTESVEDGLWIIQRFTKTYLNRWSLHALRNEWRYLHGQYPSPCDPRDMRVRHVSAEELAPLMADRLANERDPHAELTDMLVAPALTFLKDGRRTEAAALFEASLSHDHNSPHTLNNLGFCLLPDDPAQALRHLDAALETGQADVELTNANRLVALILLGRWTSACDLAMSHLTGHADSGPRPSVWLWEIESILDGTSPRIRDCDNIGSYVAALLDFVNARSAESTVPPSRSP